MARCGGGAGACNCINEAGQGVSLSGNGSVANPQVISVRPSRDANNCVRFGSDGGLYSPCSEGEAADICGISVDNLPAERLVFGRGGAGRLLGPDHALDSFRRAVDLGLDASHAHVRELGDGTPVCFPNSAMTNQTGIPDLHLSDMNLNGYKAVPIRAGWNANSTRNLGGRHGFFGFGETDKVGGTTLAEVLATVGRRSVLLLQMIPPYSDALVEKTLSLIYRYCAQESVIVGTTEIDDLDPFLNAGIPAGLFVESEEAAVLYPPQMVTDRGIEWLFARFQDVTTAQFTAYSAAGLQVVAYMANRHWNWLYMDHVGARGVISDDGLYMTADPDRYRSPTMSHNLRNPQVQPGLMGYWTDQRRWLPSGPGQPGEVYWPNQGRGFYFPRDYPAPSVPAFYMPRRADSVNPEPSGVPYREAGGVFDVSMGFLNPIPWPDNYTLDADVVFWDDPGMSRPVGFLLGMSDDRPFGDFNSEVSYWSVGLHWDGRVFCEVWENAVRVGSQYVPGPQVVEDQFYRLRVIVTPSDVTVQRLSESGAVVNQAAVTSSIARGPYSAFFKLERSGTTWYPFAVAWRDVAFTPNDPQAAAAQQQLRAPQTSPEEGMVTAMASESGPESSWAWQGQLPGDG